ncbi:hypothetical protein V1282_005696 [Nitrobacteraceae bacterium AZCC 2146]
MASQLSQTYLVQIQGAISDKAIVTGTADIAGRVVVEPLARLTQRTTYTIFTAGTLNGTKFIVENSRQIGAQNRFFSHLRTRPRSSGS